LFRPCSSGCIMLPKLEFTPHGRLLIWNVGQPKLVSDGLTSVLDGLRRKRRGILIGLMEEEERVYDRADGGIGEGF
jgi:hypothetical protein